ncbi:MAG: hypothetical protein ACYC5H_10070 [Methylovirgula sp.]
MAKHNPIGLCCSRPMFNFVGGVDDDVWSGFPSKRWRAPLRRLYRATVRAAYFIARKSST